MSHSPFNYFSSSFWDVLIITPTYAYTDHKASHGLSVYPRLTLKDLSWGRETRKGLSNAKSSGDRDLTHLRCLLYCVCEAFAGATTPRLHSANLSSSRVPLLEGNSVCVSVCCLPWLKRLCPKSKRCCRTEMQAGQGKLRKSKTPKTKNIKKRCKIRITTRNFKYEQMHKRIWGKTNTWKTRQDKKGLTGEKTRCTWTKWQRQQRSNTPGSAGKHKAGASQKGNQRRRDRNEGRMCKEQREER